MRSGSYRVLVVDDDADERFLIVRAVATALDKEGTVNSVTSGNEAIRYLCGEPPFHDRALHPFPSLLLTDLRMLDGNGFELLDFIRSNPAWSVIPKVVFSCSNDPDDIKTAFVLGANAYHQKPVSSELLTRCIGQLIRYWMTCEIPAVDASGRMKDTVRAGKLGERYPHPRGGAQMQHPRRRP